MNEHSLQEHQVRQNYPYLIRPAQCASQHTRQNSSFPVPTRCIGIPTSPVIRFKTAFTTAMRHKLLHVSQKASCINAQPPERYPHSLPNGWLFLLHQMLITPSKEYSIPRDLFGSPLALAVASSLGDATRLDAITCLHHSQITGNLRYGV